MRTQRKSRNLAGQWRFALDRENKGIREKWHAKKLADTILLPGSTEESVIPVLEEASGGKAGKEFGVVYYPEFLREGTALRDFASPPFKVVGKHDSKGAEAVIKAYEGVEAPLKILPVRSA